MNFKNESCIKADVTTGLHSIGCLRNKPDTLCQIARIQSARTQKEMKQLQKEFGVSAKPNPLLELFIDLHRYVIIHNN